MLHTEEIIVTQYPLLLGLTASGGLFRTQSEELRAAATSALRPFIPPLRPLRKSAWAADMGEQVV